MRFEDNDSIKFADRLDADGEMEIEVENFGDYNSEWIGKADAVRLIEHLKKVFVLTEEDLKP